MCIKMRNSIFFYCKFDEIDKKILIINKIKMDELINTFNRLGVSDEKQILMLKMRAIDNKYGGMFEELYGIIRDEILFDRDKRFKILDIGRIVYEMIDYMSDSYIDYINGFILFMNNNISDNMMCSDILYCIENY